MIHCDCPAYVFWTNYRSQFYPMFRYLLMFLLYDVGPYLTPSPSKNVLTPNNTYEKSILSY